LEQVLPRQDAVLLHAVHERVPGDGVLIILAIGATFFGLCVNQFRKADFSRVTVFKRGHHR
jgi:hypothetical protein